MVYVTYKKIGNADVAADLLKKNYFEGLFIVSFDF